MILIQWRKKIKAVLRKKYFREILFDIVFYVVFFVLGVILVFSKAQSVNKEPMFLIETEVKKQESLQDIDNSLSSEYKYVASSRGKYYYEINSKRANSLSEKNKLYFATAEDAKKLGFKPYFED